MSGKKLFIFVLCFNVSVLSVKSKTRGELQFNTSSDAVIVSQVMTYFFQLDEIAKPYCQKHSSVLPIWCMTCKKRRFFLGEFSGCLLALMLKNLANKQEVERLAAIFEKFLKILVSPELQESNMVDFVLQEMKNIDYPCTGCHVNAWEKMPTEPVFPCL